MSSPKHVLVLGGNGFIGAETVLTILNAHPDTAITLLNRGKSWDWDKSELLEDRVTTIRYDRRKLLSLCEPLVKLIEDTHIAAVLDFSGFEPFMVEESVRILAPHTELYIYISTDSVYEVCAEKLHSGHTKETDAIRPQDSSEHQRLASEDDYGHEKLQCEEAIAEYLKGVEGKCCSFIVLRLADVVGPRDGTDRWWQYQAWLQLAISTQTRVLLPMAYKHKPLSFVYVKDIARLITKLLFEGTENEIKSLVNQSFNLACMETPTLDQLICDLHAAIGRKDNDSCESKWPMPGGLFDYSDSDAVPQIYPSVERGPIEISKATGLLGWDPTPWEVVVKETAEFYQHICHHSQETGPAFLSERQDMYKSLKNDLAELYTKKQLRTVKEILNLTH